MKCLKTHQNRVGGWGEQGERQGDGRGGGGLGQTLIKDKPKKVQLVVFLPRTGTYPFLLLGMRQ